MTVEIVASLFRGRRCSAARYAALLIGVLSCARVTVARAAIAVVAATQHVTEKKAGGSSAWREATPGTGLNIDDEVRTGKRSKADIKFGDGSLVRLGQLSSMVMQTTKDVRLTNGQLLYVALKPGRVLAGNAAAEIKGSLCWVASGDNGTFTFSNLGGTIDITLAGQTTPLPVGHGITLFADGHLSEIFKVAPFGFLNGEQSPDLLNAPVNTPFVGSPRNIIGEVNNQFTANPLIGIVTTGSQLQKGFNTNPFIIVPPAQQSTGLPPSPFPTLAPGTTRLDSLNFASRGDAAAPATQAAAVSGPLRLAAAPETSPTVGAIEQSTGDVADSVDLGNLDTSQALHHFDEGDTGQGSGSGADVAAVGLLGSSGEQAIGAQLHGYYTTGDWYFDLAAMPLLVRGTTASGAHVAQDYTALTSASVTHRDSHGEVILGRQRFLDGPVQASLFGSMVRQGGRYIMDAAQVAPNIGPNRQLQLAYIYNAFPQNLPYDVGETVHGYYGRYAMQRPHYNLGLNLLSYQNGSVDSTTGATLDYAIPLAHDKVEFYGEDGRDPFRRTLTTVGLTSPWIYDRTDCDAYLEYADVRSSGLASREPAELAFKVDKQFGKNSGIEVALHRFYGQSTLFTVAMVVGAHYTSGSNDR